MYIDTSLAVFICLVICLFLRSYSKGLVREVAVICGAFFSRGGETMSHVGRSALGTLSYFCLYLLLLLCVYTSVCVCRVRMCLHTCVYLCACLWCVCLNMNLSACIYACVYAHVGTFMYILDYIQYIKLSGLYRKSPFLY